MAGTRTLQVRHRRLDVTVPAGTLQAAPQQTVWNLGWVVVDSITVRIPPGPSGLTGIAILYAGVPIVPSEQPGVFWVGDDQKEVWELGWEISGPFTVVTYNLDIYDHTFYLNAQVRDIVLVQAGAVQAGATVVTALPLTTPPSDQELADAASEMSVEEPLPEVPASVGVPEGQVVSPGISDQYGPGQRRAVGPGPL